MSEECSAHGEDCISREEFEAELDDLNRHIKSRWPSDIRRGGIEAVEELRRRMNE